jgi:hypothetical protein
VSENGRGKRIGRGRDNDTDYGLAKGMDLDHGPRPGQFEEEEGDSAPEPQPTAPRRSTAPRSASARPQGYNDVFASQASAAAPASPAPVEAAQAPAMATFEASTGRSPSGVGGDRLRGRDGRGKPVMNWSIYTVAELVRFRDEITQHLPPLSLSELNLEEETLLQYHTLRELQGDVLSDDDVPANQRAQVANSVATTLKTLGDQQIALYNSERFKEIENLLIRQLSKLPEETAAEFLTGYEQVVKRFKT